MVFYSPPKRLLRRKQPEKPKKATNITELPPEILLQIVTELDGSSVCKLRQSCSKLLVICNSAMQDWSTPLYLHPSPKALRRFFEICANPKLSQYIEKVIILGRAQLQEIEKAEASCREFVKSYFDFPDPRGEWTFKFRPWPQDLSSRLKSYLAPCPELLKEFLSDRNDVPIALPASYAPLVAALARLPKLRYLAFAENVQQPGFNPVTNQAIETHIKNVSGARPKVAKRKAGSTVLDSKAAMPLADADVLYGLLFESKLQFSSFRQESELAFAHIKPLRMSDLPFLRNGSDLPHLRSVTLLIDCGSDSTMSHWCSGQLLRRAKHTLEHIKIVLIPDASATRAKVDDTVARLLPYDSYSILNRFWNLKGLEITLKNSIAMVTEQKGSRRGPRHIRPLCQSYNIVDFFETNAPTLETVIITNIIFANRDAGTGSKTVLGNMSKALAALRGCTKLRQVQWNINSYEHDPRCKRSDDDSWLECTRYQCGIYADTSYGPTCPGNTVSKEGFDHLALATRVELDEATRTWDFGAAAMGQNWLVGLASMIDL